MLNYLHDQMSKSGSLPAGVPTYDPSRPITTSDIQAVKNQYPSLTPTIGDLSRPYGIPGQEPVGGTGTQPAPAPAPVYVANPVAPWPGSTQPGKQTGTSIDNPTWTKEAATESERSSAVAGIMGPLQTFIDAIPTPTFGS